MVSTTQKLIAVLIIGLIIGAIPAYFYGTTVAPSGDGVTTVTQTKTTTQTVTGGTTTVTQTITQTVTTTQPPPPTVSIVVSVYGGTTGEFFQQSGIIEAFEKQYNAEVTLETNTGAAIRTKLEAQIDDPQYDLVLMDTADALRAKDQGIVIELSETEIPNLANVYPKMIFDNSAVALMPYYIGIGYNTEKISQEDAPKGWLDLWDPKYSGVIALSPPAHAFGYQILFAAAEAEGGSVENVEPGYAKLLELKPNIATVSLSVYPLFTALIQGEIWITPMDFSSYVTYKERGAPIAWVMPEEGTYLQASVLSIIANRPAEKTEMAAKLLNYILDPMVQALWTGWSFYPPVNKDTVLSPSIVAKGIDPSIYDQLNMLDFRYVADHVKEWTDRFNQIWA